MSDSPSPASRRTLQLASLLLGCLGAMPLAAQSNRVSITELEARDFGFVFHKEPKGYALTGPNNAGIGDVNGDGLGDLLIGSVGGASREWTENFVVFGARETSPLLNLETLSQNGLGFRIHENLVPRDTGRSITALGDLDGDGFADFGLSSERYENRKGRAFVLFGGAELSDLTDLEIFPPRGYDIDGLAEGDFFSRQLAGLGDVNGDGIPDFIAASGTGSTTVDDSAYLIFGQRGRSPEPLPAMVANGRAIEMTAVKVSSDAVTSGFTGLGDLNGDGLGDFCVRPDDGTGTAEDSLVLIFGREDFAPFSLTEPGPGRVTIRKTGGFVGITEASGLGDVNGDGFHDILLGAGIDPSDGNPASGIAYVVFGTSQWQSFRLEDIGVAQPGYRIHAAAAHHNLGIDGCGLGDLNRDGHMDLALGAHNTGLGALIDTGSVYIVYGQSGTETLRLSEFTPATGWQIEGAVARAKFGETVDLAGDLDGDGYYDLAVSPLSMSVQELYSAGWVLYPGRLIEDRPATVTYRRILPADRSHLYPIGSVGPDGHLPPQARVSAGFQSAAKGEPASSRLVIVEMTTGTGGLTGLNPSQTARTRWTLSAQGTPWDTATVQFDYIGDDVQSLGESGLRLMHRPSPDAPWDELLAGVTWDHARNRVTAADLTELGEFALAVDTPTGWSVR
ncbi:MAG: integrin alpha [Sumerlaeia bacterium]